MTKKIGLGDGRDGAGPHGRSRSFGGAGDPGGGPRVERDWLEIAFLGSLVGAVPTGAYATAGLFAKLIGDMIAEGIDFAGLTPVVVGIVWIVLIVRLIRLLRGEPVPQVQESRDTDGAAPDAEYTAVPRRNWLMITVLFLFFVFWSVGVLILIGMIVWLIIGRFVSYWAFAAFLFSGFVAAWIIIFQELRDRWRGKAVPRIDLPEWPKHPW